VSRHDGLAETFCRCNGPNALTKSAALIIIKPGAHSSSDILYFLLAAVENSCPFSTVRAPAFPSANIYEFQRFLYPRRDIVGLNS
jgi:hypothetical protein